MYFKMVFFYDNKYHATGCKICFEKQKIIWLLLYNRALDILLFLFKWTLQSGFLYNVNNNNKDSRKTCIGYIEPFLLRIGEVHIIVYLQNRDMPQVFRVM